MKAFFALLVSTLAVWTVIFFFTLYVPTFTGAHSPDARPTYFLRWIPGVAIAFLSGTAGAFFNGLLEIWRTQAQPAVPDDHPGSSPSTVHFVVRPLLGAFAGLILFLFFATGGLSRTNSPTRGTRGHQLVRSFTSLLRTQRLNLRPPFYLRSSEVTFSQWFPSYSTRIGSGCFLKPARGNDECA